MISSALGVDSLKISDWCPVDWSYTVALWPISYKMAHKLRQTYVNQKPDKSAGSDFP